MLENKKDFLCVADFSPETLKSIIDLAVKMKANKKRYSKALSGKKLGMIFEKSSTRTRVSFESGIYELGGMGLFLSSRDIQIGRGEPIRDTAKVLSRYIDGIMIRTFGQDTVEELAREASIPVINGLTDETHPCQAAADYMTIYEYKKRLEGVKVAFVGDGNNVAHSLGLFAAKVGAHFSIAHPAGYAMMPEYVEKMQAAAKTTGSRIVQTADPYEAVKDADVIYTDVWASMGQEGESDERKKAFADYQVSDKLAKTAKSDYIFLHCLPAHRGEEVLSEVIDGTHSAIYDEAENRLHAQKAVMYLLMK